MAEAETWLTKSRTGSRPRGTVTPDRPILQYSTASANQYSLIAETTEPEPPRLPISQLPSVNTTRDQQADSPVQPRTLLLDPGAKEHFHIPIQTQDYQDSDSDNSSTYTTDSESSDSDWNEDSMSEVAVNATEVQDL